MPQSLSIVSVQVIFSHRSWGVAPGWDGAAPVVLSGCVRISSPQSGGNTKGY
ncbi:MAG: hypothetical protein M1608_10890 [Candidatus Omnitrophica bacterium]|nr:hypothetical protein [Candidatus Omnitrophota bacterium]